MWYSKVYFAWSNFSYSFQKLCHLWMPLYRAWNYFHLKLIQWKQRFGTDDHCNLLLTNQLGNLSCQIMNKHGIWISFLFQFTLILALSIKFHPGCPFGPCELCFLCFTSIRKILVISFTHIRLSKTMSFMDAPLSSIKLVPPQINIIKTNIWYWWSLQLIAY